MRERTIWSSPWRSQANYNTSLLNTDVIVMLDVDVKLELSSWFQAPRIRASCSCISLSRSGSSKLLTATARASTCPAGSCCRSVGNASARSGGGGGERSGAGGAGAGGAGAGREGRMMFVLTLLQVTDELLGGGTPPALHT